MKKNILFLVIGIILGLSFAVGAVYLYNAKDIEFTPNDASWNVDNMQDAINDIKGNYISKTKLIGNVIEFNYTGNYQEFIVPVSGMYKIELWGASGGGIGTYAGGKGAYTTGSIYLEVGEKLYVYVGQYGYNSALSKTFNQGQAPSVLGNKLAYSGGGATDVRLVKGEWNSFISLKSRIMVAAGGGGGEEYWANHIGGYGGALVGGNGTKSGSYNTYATGGTQTSGGLNGMGTYAGFGITTDNSGTATGGGGYYAGGNAPHNTGTVGSGAGGSSYISGYSGCNAIAEYSTEKNIIHTGQSIHYSGKKFDNPNMIAGNASMPSYISGNSMVGNTGNGYAKITLISLD